MKDLAFVHEVADRLGYDERRAATLVFCVFQELRDQLTPPEAADVAAQLPTPLNMLWLSLDYPGRGFKRMNDYQFLREVRRIIGQEDDIQAVEAISCVVSALLETLDNTSGLKGETRRVFRQSSDLKKSA